MTQNPKIYRIDKTLRLLKNQLTTRRIITVIINTHLKSIGLAQNFKSTQLKIHKRDGFRYYLYAYNSNEIFSDWQNFLPSDLTNDAAIFTQQKLSLIVFIKTDRDELFAVIGGNSYQIILPFIDQSFGLDTYSRIMKPEYDELASMKSRGLTGSIVGQSQQYRGVYRIIDFIKFGKVPQEIHLKLSAEISNLHFSFLKNKPNERIQVFVGKAFKIKKNVDFENLHRIIKELGFILELDKSDYLSSYEEIKDSNFIENFCKPELINRMFNDIGNINGRNLSPHNKFEYDFVNPNDIAKFYEADYYVLKEKTGDREYTAFKTVYNKDEIYESVILRALELHGDNDQFKFKVFLQGVRVLCYQNNRKKSTVSSGFLFHISTEFPVQEKPIFLIDSKWYILRDSFISDLKTNTKHILQSYPAPANILFEPWDKSSVKTKTEKKYNLLYKNVPNYIVVDTIIADGLELCDILYYDADNIYLVHVKYGFSSSMRELSNQVTISGRRLREVLGTQKRETLEKVYQKLVDKKRIKNLSLGDFKNLFNKKITYVFAFTSHLKKDLKIVDNIDLFDSNIARYSLIQCSSDMRQNYYDMLTYQIPRT